MGGSGGSYWPTSKMMGELLKETMSEEDKNIFIRNVNEYLQETLGDLDDRDNEGIQRHIDTLIKALEKDIEGSLDMEKGGSLSKNTYANGLSDVDILVLINDSSLIEASPKEVIDNFANRIKERLPNSEVSTGNLAVTVKFSDGHEIQLLPSIKIAEGFRIAQAEDDEWSSIIHPERFAQKLKDINRECNHKVLPVIKLFKSMNRNLPEGLQLSGYHIESLAINAFKSYDGKFTYYHMVNHLCESASKATLKPIVDRTGQSLHVDEYLGGAGSILRIQVCKAFERLSNRMKRAEFQGSIDGWKKLID